MHHLLTATPHRRSSVENLLLMKRALWNVTFVVAQTTIHNAAGLSAARPFASFFTTPLPAATFAAVHP
jgi:hypothetical protein